MIPTSPWSWSKLKLGWRHVPATCFCRPICGCPWEGWDSTYNHSVDVLPWCRRSTTDQKHVLTMVGLLILFRLRTRGFSFCQETIVIPDEPTPQKKMDPESEDRFNYKNCVICTASWLLCQFRKSFFCATPMSFNQSQTYWPQDDPDHWSYYEDSQAGTMIGKYWFHCSEPNF